MTAVILKSNAPPPASSKNGEGYDRCPSDGCVEVDRQFQSGGVDARGAEYLDWSMYNADPQAGGCGTTWSRTTSQGRDSDQKRGINPKWLTDDAAVGRSYSFPTDQYRSNYEAAFGHS